MSNSYIPDADADFSVWLQNFVTYATSDAPNLGLASADLTPLQNAATDFGAAIANNEAAQANAMAMRTNKDNLRATAESITRGLVGRIQAHPGVTDAARNSLGITVRSGTRTRVEAPTTRPIAQVDTNQRLRHTVAFVDELTPTSRAKPDGVQGCEIWAKVGDPAPSGPSEVHYLALDTRTPYVSDFDDADAGKTAYYMLRWVSTRGEAGPWSQTVSATITN